MTVMRDLDLDINASEVKRRLGMTTSSKAWGQVSDMILKTRDLLRPQWICRPSDVQDKSETTVAVEGVLFRSKVLRKNLDQAERVFPFVVTLGDEVEKTLRRTEDPLQQYYLDTIANVALVDVLKSLGLYLNRQYKLEKLAYMNPGSLPDWPLQEQAQLFRLLGDVSGSIGVHLTPSMLMMPSKSLSGIYFPTEVSFESCQLCPRQGCPSRKAAYDRKLASDYGLLDQG